MLSLTRQLNENASLPGVAAVKADVERAVTEAKEALNSEDAERIKAATTSLAQVAMKIGEAVYSAGGGAGGGPETGGTEGGGAAGGGDNVVDADFEEVKDDKKKSA